jgi:hypothetical protein
MASFEKSVLGRRASAPRGLAWPAASAGCLLGLALGCGRGDAGSPQGPEGAGGGGQAGADAASVDTSAGGGTAGHAGASGAAGSKAGSAGVPADGGGDAADVSIDGVADVASEADAGCKSDKDCTANPAGQVCDPKTGKCVQCKPADPSACPLGQYCDETTSKCAPGCDSPQDCQTGADAGPDAGALSCDTTTHKCVNCTKDAECPPGLVCKASSCEPGCTQQHACQSGFTCCAAACIDTANDMNNCGGCGKPCSIPQAQALCAGGNCIFQACQPGFADCDISPGNGCETPVPDGGTGCACQPGQVKDCYAGPPGTEGVGPCKAGKTTCNAAGTAWGPCAGQVLPSTESCFTALDDDCDGQVNEDGPGCVCKPGVTEACYTGPAQTRNTGACKDGSWTCNALGSAWSNCDGQVLPSGETCLTPVDDDCDGEVNEAGGAGCACTPSSTAPCYGGPPGTENVGPCKAGTQTCDAMGTGYGPCTGDVVPAPDACTDSIDNDCNGVANDGVLAGAAGCVCFPSAVSTCYTGPANTLNVGVCKSGIATCNALGTAWGICGGQVTPSTDHCTDALDNDCNGVVNDGFGKGGQGCVCAPGAQLDCYDGPPGTLGVGMCVGGKKTCAADGKAWGPCLGQIIPDLDSCLDSLDNDCNGVVNDGNHTAPGCACVPGTTKCVNDTKWTCNSVGDWANPKPGCVCSVGEFSCSCNQVLQCDPGPPAKWVPKSPSLVCSASAGQKCNAATGTCVAVPTVGSTVPTGTYYRYAYFTSSNSPLIVTGNVDDVDSYGDYIYVNRGPWYQKGIALDVYKVTLLDSDGDGKLEPNQHPNSPTDPGPIEQRTLTFVKTYLAAAPDNAPMGICHRGEMYATADRVFTLGPNNNGDITEYLFATKTSNVVAHSLLAFPLSMMGFGEQDTLWYAGYEGARRVYSFCPAAQAWVAEFGYPNLAGSHMDGLEVIVSPKTQTQYVYVSDMTSDFLGQYRRDGAGGWVQENLFRYQDVSGAYVEGMGFGALNHFWIASGSAVYEIGGGDLTAYLQ